jgi:CRP-like cAMP-binding protein
MAEYPRNKLLRFLETKAFDRIASKLIAVELSVKQVLYAPEQAIDRIYFPEDSVISQMSVMADGRTIETGTVGFEGASWVSASIGAPSMPCETLVVIAGDAHALGIEELRQELAENEPFRDILTQYSHALLIHSMRLVGCTGLHSLRQRCARWILYTLDQVREDQFAVTHELLAMLLGATRPSVSAAIEELARDGAVTVTRGHVALGSRDALRAASCDCYGVISRHYAQVGKHASR